jgi:N-acetylneuraminate synthase/N,N'-diacetyllegionaminate synthase
MLSHCRNFNGDLDIAKQSIAEAAACGVDAVKFQTFRADEFVADKNLTYSYALSDGSIVTETQYEMFKRLELPVEWHRVLQHHALMHGVDFLSSAADRQAVDLLVSLDVPAIKLASEDLVNVRLLEYVASSRQPVILSTGMADLAEIQRAVKIFEDAGHHALTLLHCISAYPAAPASCNLRRILALREQFNYPIGFSDHTIGADAAVVAVALGATVIEKHFTLDHNLPGPDHAMSATPDQFRELVAAVRKAETMLGNGSFDYNPAEETGRKEFRRSIVAARAINPGEVIVEGMLDYKRPGSGLKPYQREMLLGKCTVRYIAKDEVLLPGDVVDADT